MITGLKMFVSSLKYLKSCLPNAKIKRIIPFCVITSILFYVWVVAVFPNNTITRLWLRDVQANIKQLLNDSIKINENLKSFDRHPHLIGQYSSSFSSVYKRTGISCPELFLGRLEAVQRSREYMNQNERPVFSSEYYFKLTSNCTDFKKKRTYMTKPESEEEASFPIAYSVLIYKDFQLAERLLRSIYVPQNYYCLHVDGKAPKVLKEVMEKIADCFPNVFLPKRLISVSWGHMSIMYAEMVCMEELLRYKWKYFINLSGQMFPTRSNAEIVKILKLFKGANDVEGSDKKAKNMILRFRQLIEWRHSDILDINVFTLRLKPDPPYNVTIYTGTNQVILSRAFVAYFLYSKTSHDIIDWYSNTLVPDEYIWSTLNHNVHLLAPGAFKGDAENKPTLARLSLWQSFFSSGQWRCQGQWKRELCIFGVGDLQWLIKQPQLFVNKFHSDFEWLALDCMEELVFNRTLASLYKKVNRFEWIGRSLDISLNMTFYESVPFIKNRSSVISLKESALWKFYSDEVPPT